MFRQYHAPGRRRGGPNALGLGVVDVGAAFYLQDESWLRDRYRGRPVCRAPWVVEAFLNGTMSAAAPNLRTGRWEDRTISRRSDMAIVRCLRTGRHRTIAVRVLVLHQDLDLEYTPRVRSTRRTLARPARPVPAEDTGVGLHLLTPSGQPVRGVLESIPACSTVANLHIEPDGSIGFDFRAWAEQWVEDARPELRRHAHSHRPGFIFVDYAGGEHHEDDLLRCQPGARQANCPHCIGEMRDRRATRRGESAA